MQALHLHEFHSGLGASFSTVNNAEVVINYGETGMEYAALKEQAAILDLSFRSRVCVTGADRLRFLHGQVTNDIKGLKPGEGTYAALVNAKGRMESDLNIYSLSEEMLLDFEPGLTETVSSRLEKYIVADDVQVIDIAPLYGLLSIQGPQAPAVIQNSGLFSEIPEGKYQSKHLAHPQAGELYLMNVPRIGTSGFDLFVPLEALAGVAERIWERARVLAGRWAGWEALETARIELGIPRFGIDMDNSTFPQECGIDASAVSYNKGCYVGQEVLNRIHTLGHVNRQLRGLRLAKGLSRLPVQGDKLFFQGKEVGTITSATTSPKLRQDVALGIVRREGAAIGTELKLSSNQQQTAAWVMALPFESVS